MKSVQKIIEKCVKLKEINIGITRLSDSTLDFLAENFPTQIEKLDLGSLSLSDRHFK